MNNHLPFDRPIVPLTQLSFRDWRSTPDLRVEGEQRQIIDEVAWLVANESARIAGANSLRMLHYNLLVDNGYRNKHFEDAVKFACDLAELYIVNRTRFRIDEDLAETVKDALGLQAALLITTYPEIVREISQQVESAANKNCGVYHQFIKEIEIMYREDPQDYRSNRGSRDPRDSRDSRPRDSYDDRNSGRYDSYRDGGRGEARYDRLGEYRDDGRGFRNDRYESRRDDGRGFRDSRDSRDSRSGGSGVVRSNRYSNESTQPTAFSRAPQSRDIREAPVRWGNTGYTDQQPQVATPQSYTNETEAMGARNALQQSRFIDNGNEEANMVVDNRQQTTPQAPPSYLGVLTPEKGTEMDQAKHAAAYFVSNGQYNPEKDRTKEFERLTSLALAMRNPDVNPEKIADLLVIEDSLAFTENLNVLITDTSVMAAKAVAKHNNTRVLFRTLGIVSNPFFGNPVLNQIQTAMSQAQNMTDLHFVMKSSLKATEDQAAEEASASDIRGAMDYYNRIITNEINAYVADSMGLTPSGSEIIDSFIEDFPSLVPAIQSNYGRAKADDLLGFFSEFMKALNEKFDPSLDLEASLRNLYSLEEDKDIAVMYLPHAYCVTHIPFTLRELGYTEKQGGAIIDPLVTPFMHSLLLNKTTGGLMEESILEMGRFTEVLVTRDKRAFRVYRCFNNQNQYSLSPLSI